MSSTITFVHVDWNDPRALALRAAMDDEMNLRYAGPGQSIDEAVQQALTVSPADVRATVLALDGDKTPIGHAALRVLRGDWEVKRVIVIGDQRGRGVGAGLMNELERRARAEHPRVSRLILQTGNKQPEAVGLYTKLGYTPIDIYEPYGESMPDSLCFEKLLD